MASVEVPASWRSVLELKNPGTVMVLADTGTGKTWLARFLAEEWARRRRRTAPVNADMGQAWIGVPTCLALAEAPHGDRPHALWFVGDTKPLGHLLPAVVGTARLAHRARHEGNEIVVIDPTGLILDPVGRVLKYHKALAAQVSTVVAVQRNRELEPLLELLSGVGVQVVRLAAAPQAHDRTLPQRQEFREARFRLHLQGATTIHVPRALLLGPDWLPGSGPAPAHGSVLGLLDREGFCLGLGLFEAADADGIDVFTACNRPSDVTRVQPGRVRLTRDGREIEGTVQ